MSPTGLVLKQLDHRERLLLKQVLQAHQLDRTPASQVMHLADHSIGLPWDPTNPNQFFLGIHIGNLHGQRIGTFWGVRRPEQQSARLYDFQLNQQGQHANLGMEALETLEHWLLDQGCAELRLEVQNHDPLTQALLEKSGYRVDYVRLRKNLIGSHGVRRKRP